MSGVSRTNRSKELNVRTTAKGIIRSMSSLRPMQASVLASMMAISGEVCFMFQLMMSYAMEKVISVHFASRYDVQFHFFQKDGFGADKAQSYTGWRDLMDHFFL